MNRAGLTEELIRDVEEAVLAFDPMSLGWPSFERQVVGIKTLRRLLVVLRAPGAGCPVERPEIVCLCGSTRFYDAFQEANYDLTMAGKIVLSVGFYPHSKAEHGHGEGVGHDSTEKVALDELHKRKIDLADRVFVLNVGGYIGSSTRGEIDYAIAHGRPVDYLEPEAAPRGTARWEHGPIRIWINRGMHPVQPGYWTVDDLRLLPTPAIDASHDLYRVVPGANDELITDGIEAFDGLRIFSFPRSVGAG